MDAGRPDRQTDQPRPLGRARGRPRPGRRSTTAEALVAGADSLHEAEAAGLREAVGAVAGLDVLHLQCHIGFDAISLARRGARVVGVDFSPASLEKARALARRCEVDVEFVEADAAALPVELHNRFDLVYATIGVICWIDDLRAWMRSAAAALRGGGKLLLVDIHPVYEMVESTNPLRFDFPYAHDGAARVRRARLVRRRRPAGRGDGVRLLRALARARS